MRIVLCQLDNPHITQTLSFTNDSNCVAPQRDYTKNISCSMVGEHAHGLSVRGHHSKQCHTIQSRNVQKHVQSPPPASSQRIVRWKTFGVDVMVVDVYFCSAEFRAFIRICSLQSVIPGAIYVIYINVNALYTYTIRV